MNDQPTNPRQLVDTRAKTHGDYPAQAEFYEEMMAVWENHANWERMPPYMRYTIRYTTQKQARIACGDYKFIDHWADISGYIQLVVDELVRMKERSTPWHMKEIDIGQGTPEDGSHHHRYEDPSP